MTEPNSDKRYAWIYLINLSFYFVPLFLNSYELWQIILSVVIVPPFIGCYFWAYNSRQSRALYPILAMIGIGAAITPVNPGSLSLFTFAGFFIGFFYSLRQALIGYVGLIALLAVLNYLSGFNYFYFVTYGALLIAAVGLFGIVERRRQQTKRKLQQSNDEIAQLAKIVERERIARDMHDIIGHSLSSIALKAELAGKLVDKQQNEAAQQQLNELAKIARESLGQLRKTVSDYKHTGLAANITELCQRLREKGISASLVGEVPTLPAKIESQMILIMTELSSNMLRHSQASLCEIELQSSDYELTLSLTEDHAPNHFIEGNGIQGIRERVESLQGKFSYDLNEQLRFSIVIPLQPAEVK